MLRWRGRAEQLCKIVSQTAIFPEFGIGVRQSEDLDVFALVAEWDTSVVSTKVEEQFYGVRECFN